MFGDFEHCLLKFLKSSDFHYCNPHNFSLLLCAMLASLILITTCVDSASFSPSQNPGIARFWFVDSSSAINRYPFDDPPFLSRAESMSLRVPELVREFQLCGHPQPRLKLNPMSKLNGLLPVFSRCNGKN